MSEKDKEEIDLWIQQRRANFPKASERQPEQQAKKTIVNKAGQVSDLERKLRKKLSFILSQMTGSDDPIREKKKEIQERKKQKYEQRQLKRQQKLAAETGCPDQHPQNDSAQEDVSPKNAQAVIAEEDKAPVKPLTVQERRQKKREMKK